jgi:hypothetical protein
MVNPLASCSVLDSTGTSIPLPDLWAKGPVVLAFVRHFG